MYLIDRVMDFVEQGVGVPGAVRLALDEVSDADVRAELGRRLDSSVRNRCRKLIDEHDPEQLPLFPGTYLPRVIRVVRNDEEDFIPPDCATTRPELIDGCAYRVERVQRTLRIAESQLDWAASAAELDAWADCPPGTMLGTYRYADVTCYYRCGRGWQPSDPYEVAHEVPVASGVSDGRVELAHRSCNRAAGAK